MAKWNASRGAAGVVLILLSAAGWWANARAAETATPAAIDPEALALVQEMGRSLGGVPAFSFHAEITYDAVMHSGRKLQFAAALDAAVRRPDRLSLAYVGDLGGRRLWYDGKRFTLLDIPAAVYAETDAPGGLSAMLQRMEAEHGVSPPLADLLTDDPSERLLQGVRSAFVVGPGDVGGETCQHLAFSSEGLDWQIWIASEGRPVPRKLVLTYRHQPGAPQYVAVLSDWKFPKTLPEERFQATLPDGAEAVDVVALDAAPEAR